MSWVRLRAADHGVLATRHDGRGVDAVPVVFAVADDDRIVIPIDTVKPKATTRLQRLANIAADPRVSLLVEHYEADWSRLWWVRVSGRAVAAPVTDEWAALLAAKYPAYRAPGAIASLIVVVVDDVASWSASGS